MVDLTDAQRALLQPHLAQALALANLMPAGLAIAAFAAAGLLMRPVPAPGTDHPMNSGSTNREHVGDFGGSPGSVRTAARERQDNHGDNFDEEQDLDVTSDGSTVAAMQGPLSAG